MMPESSMARARVTPVVGSRDFELLMLKAEVQVSRCFQITSAVHDIPSQLHTSLRARTSFQAKTRFTKGVALCLLLWIENTKDKRGVGLQLKIKSERDHLWTRFMSKCGPCVPHQQTIHTVKTSTTVRDQRDELKSSWVIEMSLCQESRRSEPGYNTTD